MLVRCNFSVLDVDNNSKIHGVIIIPEVFIKVECICGCMDAYVPVLDYVWKRRLNVSC
jgi:hypothetical protein